jgi:hypothetical protein
VTRLQPKLIQTRNIRRGASHQKLILFKEIIFILQRSMALHKAQVAIEKQQEELEEDKVVKDDVVDEEHHDDENKWEDVKEEDTHGSTEQNEMVTRMSPPCRGADVAVDLGRL